MACVGNVLVVGGGVAGLTAAAAIAQRGMACELVEVAGEPIGAAIMIYGRALDALESIGVRKACAAEGTPDPLRGLRQIGPGMPAIGLYRPVLSRILRERAEAMGARLRMGIGVKDLCEVGDQVEARFSDGSVRRYDLVVGSDGIRSTVRPLIFGDDVQPTYTGQCNVRWMTPGAPIPNLGTTYFAPWGKLLTYPLPQNLIYAITVFARDTPTHVDQDTARGVVREQLDAFAESEIRALRDRITNDTAMIYRPFEWLMVPGRWHRGRVVLIGDAAHATTAHMSSGGGMAIEDGVVLGEELASATSLPKALDAFMRRRLERVRLVVETSVAMSKMEADGVDPKAIMAHSRPAFAALATAY